MLRLLSAVAVALTVAFASFGAVAADPASEKVIQEYMAAWNAHDAAILRAVEELLADFAISDATWATLAASWDEQQMIELPMMVGQYLTTAFILNSLHVQLGAGNKGLDHR